MSEAIIEKLVSEVADFLESQGKMLVTAESCTGGLIGGFCTERAGSSNWFFGGVISYDNSAKEKGLGVSSSTLATYGAVSAETIVEMCAGALRLGGDVAIAVSGVAGPSGGSEAKPVGCVYIGWQWRGREPIVERCQFSGDRHAIRQATVIRALEGVLS